MWIFNTFEMVWSTAAASPRLWAYLDPGMGSIVFQVLLAGALSASFFVKSWARQVRAALPWARK